MKRLFKAVFILALILCFTLPVFAIKILPYNVPLQDLMRWDKYGATLKLSNPEGENISVAWATTVDLWNYDGSTWTYDLPSGDTFAFGKGVAITGDSSITGDLTFTGDILMTTTSKIQFHDTGIYINASSDGRMAISSDSYLAVDVTDSCEITTPILTFIATTSVIHEYDDASFITTTINNAGAVKVDVTGDTAGAYEIETDDAAILLDAETTVNLDAAGSMFDFTSTGLEMNTLTITEAGNITANDAAGPAILNEAAAAANPTLIPDRRDFTTGIGFDSAETVTIVLGGIEEYSFDGTDFDMNSNTMSEAGNITVTNAAGPAIINLAATNTVPTLIPNQNETDTGIGWQSDVIHIVLGTADEYSFSTTILDMNANHLDNCGYVAFDAVTWVTGVPGIWNEGTGELHLNAITARTIVLEIADVAEYSFSATTLDLNDNTITEAGDILANNAQGFALVSEASSVTNPTLVPDRRDESTGIGFDSPEVVVVVLGGVEEYSFDTTDFDMNDNTLSEVGLLTSSGGIVLEDEQTVAYGTGSDVTKYWNNTRGTLATAPAGNFVSPEGMSDRFRLEWVAGQRGKPGMNADIADSSEFATLVVTDPDFEILGTGSSNDDITFYAEGGIVLETDGSDGDEEILLPHLTANQSAWEQVTWGTDNEVRWEANIRTGDSIETSIIWAGLKLTNTEVMTTDDDQLYFRYEDGVNGGEWEAITTINSGTDDNHDTNVVVATTTNYHLVIEIDNTGIATFYINGTSVETGDTFAGNHADLIPYVGVAEDGGSSARSLIIRGQVISREYD